MGGGEVLKRPKLGAWQKPVLTMCAIGGSLLFVSCALSGSCTSSAGPPQVALQLMEPHGGSVGGRNTSSSPPAGGAGVSVWTAPGSKNIVSEEFKAPEPSEGGLNDAERAYLSDKATFVRRVCEWGMGESTRIFAHRGVPFVRSIDSAPSWVADVKASVPKSWEVLHGDIGPVGPWGFPTGTDDASKKRWEDYIALGVEGQEPFDLYFADGRFRVACALTALIHGMGNGTRTRDHFRVMVHDWSLNPEQRGYHALLKVAEMVDGSSPWSLTAARRNNLVVLRRKGEASDAEILALFEKHKTSTW